MFPPEFFVIRTEPLGLCHLVHRVIAEYRTGQSLCLGAIYGTGGHWYWIDHTTALPNTTQYRNPPKPP